MYVIKFMLLIAVFSTSTVMGILMSKKFSNRARLLKDLKNALNIFEVKINFSFETIPEIFKDISNKIDGIAGKIFISALTYMNEEDLLAGEAWEKSIDVNGYYLKKDDINSLKTLGKLLGRTDIEGQVSQIQLVSSFLEKQIIEAEDSKNKNEKMYQKLGAIVGLVLVIVLI